MNTRFRDYERSQQVIFDDEYWDRWRVFYTDDACVHPNGEGSAHKDCTDRFFQVRRPGETETEMREKREMREMR